MTDKELLENYRNTLIGLGCTFRTTGEFAGSVLTVPFFYEDRVDENERLRDCFENLEGQSPDIWENQAEYELRKAIEDK